MADADLQHRVEMLENTVESLRKLPAEVAQLRRRMGWVESQTLQLRTEMRGEFSAMRAEMRGEMRDEFSVMRAEMRGELSAVRDEMHAEMSGMATKAELRDAIAGAVLQLTGAIVETRDELRQQIADAQQRTTLLFEDVI